MSRPSVTALPSTYSISMRASSQPVAGVGVGDGDGEAAAAGRDQDEVEHQDAPTVRQTARAIARCTASRMPTSAATTLACGAAAGGVSANGFSPLEKMRRMTSIEGGQGVGNREACSAAAIGTA